MSLNPPITSSKKKHGPEAKTPKKAAFFSAYENRHCDGKTTTQIYKELGIPPRTDQKIFWLSWSKNTINSAGGVAVKIKGNFFFHVGNKHATITYWLHAGEIGWRSRWHPVEICCIFNTNMGKEVSLDFRGLCYCNGE